MEKIENIPLFISVSFTKNGERKEADAETRDFYGTPDCKIGNFGENWWIRPKKAQSQSFKGYGDIKNWKKAIKMTLIKRGCSDIIFNN
jgi:hypothetical protein